jgi:osmotically-inducible protein OsmY
MDFPERPIRCDRAGEVEEMGKTQDIREAVEAELNALIADDSDVVVDTKGNTVTLTGHVRTWAEHDAAVGAAWMAGGVFEAHDDLAITG